MDLVTSEIINTSHTLKKLLYAREKFTEDEKLIHALNKARASLIRLEKTITQSNSVHFQNANHESKLMKILHSDVTDVLNYEIPINKILSVTKVKNKLGG